MSVVDREEFLRVLDDIKDLLESGFSQVNARLDAINGRLRRNEERVAEHSATLQDYGQIREMALRADVVCPISVSSADRELSPAPELAAPSLPLPLS